MRAPVMIRHGHPRVFRTLAAAEELRCRKIPTGDWSLEPQRERKISGPQVQPHVLASL